MNLAVVSLTCKYGNALPSANVIGEEILPVAILSSISCCRRRYDLGVETKESNVLRIALEVESVPAMSCSRTSISHWRCVIPWRTKEPCESSVSPT